MLFDEMYDREDGDLELDGDEGVAEFLRMLDGPADDLLDGVDVSKYKFSGRGGPCV